MIFKSCPVSGPDRLVRIIVAVLMLAFAVTNYQTLALAIPAGVLSLFVVYTVVTGSCPLISGMQHSSAREEMPLATPKRLNLLSCKT